MSTHIGRLIKITLLSLLLIGVGSSLALAQLTLEVSPTAATSNSVWNFKAVWKNSKGIWPLGRPLTMTGGSVTEGHVDWGGVDSAGNELTATIGVVRPPLVESGDEVRWYPQLYAPQGFVGFGGLPSQTEYELSQALGWVWVQPDPVPIAGEMFVADDKKFDRGRYDCGLDFQIETIPYPPKPEPGDPYPVVEVQISSANNGTLVPAVIKEQEGVTIPAPTEEDPDATFERPATPAVVVPTYGPIWLVGVWAEPGHQPIRANIRRADQLYAPTTDVPGWPEVNVIELPDNLPSPNTYTEITVAYYRPGTHYVVTQRHPLPMPYTVYELGVTASDLDRVKFNPEILRLDTDTNKQDPVSWDIGEPEGVGYSKPRLGDATIALPGNPLYGIYATRNLDTDADNPTNYAQYFETYYDEQVDEADKLAFLLTADLPQGAHDPDPVRDKHDTYTGDKVWVRFLQRAILGAGGNATLENPSVIKSIKGVYTNTSMTSANYWPAGTPYDGAPTISLAYEPPANQVINNTVWVDCRAQVRMTVDGHSNVVTTEQPISAVFADDDDKRYALYSVLGVFLDESCTGTNFFVPYEPAGVDHPDYAAFNLPLARRPDGGWPTLHLKLRSYSVNKVTTDAKGQNANLCAQSSGGAYDAKMGLIRLNTSGSVLTTDGMQITKDAEGNEAWTGGPPVYVWYSALSQTTLTPGNPAPGTVQTPSDNILGIQAFTDPGAANPNYTFDTGSLAPGSGDQNKIVLDAGSGLPEQTTSVQIDITLREPDNGGRGAVWLGNTPMYYVEGDPITGAEYRCAVSAGLNMSNPLQQPSIDWLENNPETNNRLIYDPRQRPMYYMGLVANADGTPRTWDVPAAAYYVDDGGLLQTVTVQTAVTAHDSTPGGGLTTINYGGMHHNKDSLTCYPNTRSADWPQGYDIDPLTVEPIEHSNLSKPDDGSSSTQFVFRVRYHNEDGLPPLPWLHEADDPWHQWGSNTASGVVLYLDHNGTGDYRPHFMQLENRGASTTDDQVYIYRFLPRNWIGVEGNISPFPHPEWYSDEAGTFFDNMTYQSLACGTYHYFFACSDDSLHFDGGTLPFENQSVAGRLQWGEQVAIPLDISYPVRNSTGLDPSLPRAVTGYSDIDRAAKRRYSSTGGATAYDRTLFVDRPVRVPGFFEGTDPYPWQSEYHPRVTCELRMPSMDDQAIRYDDKSYGYGRFFGTLTPFYRASNPLLPGTRVGGHPASLAETSGATTKTENRFRILWKQIDNKAPIRIQIFINNASERSPNDAAHQYTGYTMNISQNQSTPLDYRKGVWYEYTSKLPAGPHTYYFEAYDGEHTVRWPTRPDTYSYGGSFTDWWVPTNSKPTERALESYVDNDYVPGPYVNTPCVLSSASVTPGTGKEGTDFTYRVKYSDADGQRVHSAYIYIKINDRGDVRKFAMLPVAPFTDPTADHSAEYRAGVEYYLRTGTIKDLGLEPGVRQFYFEFTDDWGRQGDINDLVQGETTRYPAGAGNWIDGPIISKNNPPTLSTGSVESQDGTANAGTLWTYRVTYRDIDNDAPVLKKVFIGLLQSDHKTIMWDEGHDLLEDNTGDKTYLDGKTYYFQTQLGGVDAVAEGQLTPEPKQYYYAFEAYDGIDWATYKSSSQDATRSNAAGCLVMQDLIPDGGSKLNYTFRPLLAQRAAVVNSLDITPDDPSDIVAVTGVYLTENLSADATRPQTYYDPALDTNVFKYGDTTIPLASALTNGTVVNIRYVAVTVVGGEVLPGAVKTQTGTVTGGTYVVPDNLTDILRVVSVTTDQDPITNYYLPFDTIRLNVGSGLPAGTTTAWVEYEGQSPLVGPLPIDLPPPSGVIPDPQLWEDYTSFPVQIPIDDQKNGWVSSADPDDRGKLTMTGQCASEGSYSSQYVTPDDASSIASVEGVYLTPDFSGMNYVQTQVWKVDSSDPTRRTIKRTWQSSDPLASRLRKVYGVYINPDLTGENYYNNPAPEVGTNPGWVDGFRAVQAMPLRQRVQGYTGQVANPADVESIVGLYRSKPASYEQALGWTAAGDSYYDPEDRTAVQRTTVTLLVKPDDPQWVKTVLGVYLYQDLSGDNYYDPALADPVYTTGDTYIRPTSSIPQGTTSAWVQFVNATDIVQEALFAVVGAEVDVEERDSIKQIRGVYDNEDLTGTNYYNPLTASTAYQHGDQTIILTSEMPGDPGFCWIKYENLGFGFGADANRIASDREWPDDGFGNLMPMYLAYFRGGVPATSQNTSSLSLSTSIPEGMDFVYVQASGDTFNCGDTAIKLLDDLYATDAKGTVVAPLVVKPTDSTLIGGVVGVFTSQAVAESGDVFDLTRSDNLYAAVEAPFKVGDTVIRLKSSLSNPPAVGTSNLYIVYVPKKAYVKYSDVRYTHQLAGMAQQPDGPYYYRPGTTHYTPSGWNASVVDRNGEQHINVFIKSNLREHDVSTLINDKTDRASDWVSGGVIGVWRNSYREGTNFFDPKKSTRHSIDPLHLRLTTATPAAVSLWARHYQRGEYHIDRSNRRVEFLSPRNGRVQASYFFGTKMPQTIGANTPPELVAGSAKVTPLYGSRSTQFVYSVTYRDLDGPNGQAPSYVRVYVNKVPYDMEPVAQGIPPYREGATFTLTLSSGSFGTDNTYHFEASDGAAVAWYDANGPHQSLVGSITESIVDFNGPWINDPPTLTSGYADPNPTSGGINPWDSVTYFVTYSDADNDEPYKYATTDTSLVDENNNGIRDVIEYSGSPRVWVDSGAFDTSYSGTVAALEASTMDVGKRVIVASGTPGWTADQFAGKLMQITNGALTGRVYLIQSNTTNKLTIATSDLASDGIVAGGANASQFVINGLLMSKADATQQDFTKGVVYKLTVPKLAVGTHKFHFTARSRQNKPVWLLEQLTEAEQVPYSALVRYPLGVDANGPTVVNTPPPGNVAPVISNSQATSLYVGPRDQMASFLTVNTVGAYDAGLWAMIRELRGVFIDANDFDLNTITSTAEQANSYYNPLTANPTYVNGDSSILLTTALPASPPTSMVSFGAVSGDALIEIVPEKASAIGQVTGVYLLSDPTLAGTNYFESADGSESGTFDGSRLTLKRALPTGTKRVYVAFVLGGGKTWSDVPLYLKYFSLDNPTAFKTTDLVTFRIKYSDADGDAPSYHDNVQGYVKVVFNDLNLSYQMSILDPVTSGGVINYVNETLFTSGPVTLPEGTHKYHFEASDGYYTVRFPTGVLGDVTANDYPLKVNYKPVILSAQVDPPTGQAATTFAFTARYRDSDGVSTIAPRVTMRIFRLDGTGTEVFREMIGSGTNYQAGVNFTSTIVPRDLTPALAAGIYKVIFEATDPDGEEADAYPASTAAEITFAIREAGSNNAPRIESCSVENTSTGSASGKISDYFNYKARYSDADGDAPLSLDGKTRDVLLLTIDKGTTRERTFNLVKAPDAPANLTPQNYIDGVNYQLASPISGRTLGGGDHTYVVSATDGISTAEACTGEGPLLLIPYFDNFRLVSAVASDPTTAPAMASAVVGDEVLIVGNLSFPRNNDPNTVPPTSVDNIAIKITKPDGTQLTLDASAVPVNWTGELEVYYLKAQNVDPAFVTGDSLTLTASGVWVVTANWPGNSVWDEASTEGNEASVAVDGPMRTVAVSDTSRPAESSPIVDMITPPRIIGSSDPGRIFGYERAAEMRVVRWDPSVGAYLKYDVQGQFPALTPGDAVWIKPKTTYPADPITQSQVESGLLSLGNPEAGVDYTKQYRLILTFVKDYTKDSTTGKLDPCYIQLRRGWNQFGNIFYNWKRLGDVPVTPRQDAGIPISEVKVKYLNEVKTLDAASAAGWIRDYAWGYDAVGHQYVQVSASAANRVLLAWRGYWIRAFVDCQLIIDPNTSYNGFNMVAPSTAPNAVDIQQLDAPPPIPE